MTKKILLSLSDIDKAYLAGFFDADGSLIVQIVKDSSRQFKFYIRISLVFYQKNTSHWFILWLKKIFKPYGYVRKRDNMSEFTIVSKPAVYFVLKELYPYLKLKKPLAKLTFKILEDLKYVETKADFLKVCQKVDETANYTYSSKRKITSSYVESFLNSPVETSLK